MSLQQRSYEKELLDGDNIAFEDILLNMQEINTISSFLGGHNVTCNGIAFFLDKVNKNQPLLIAEIGCGGGDNLRALDKFLKKRKCPATFIGIDIKAECIRFAQQNTMDNVEWICSDYHHVKWPGNKPDIVFSSLFCHHFTDERLVKQLQWMKNNSRVGFFINDLQRHPIAYHSIRFITKYFFKSYLVKNDAPLSVKRAFIRKDWIKLLSAAGIRQYNIKWQWAFRFLICASNEQ